MKNLIPFLAFSMVLGCGGDDSSTVTQVFSADPPLVIGGEERPASVDIPKNYDPEESYPLLMVLHGHGVDGRTQTGYFQLFSFVDEKQFVLVYPDGIPDAGGENAWNATEVCCASDDTIDDVGYLRGLIEEAQQTYNIDSKRVYLMGHSNGGFMSFRMLCEASDLITAIVSLAGSSFDDPNDCQPATQPVSALVVHGTADDTVLYDGGMFSSGELAFSYPGAVEIIERTASAGGCDTSATSDEGPVDLVPSVEGIETDRVAYETGCDEGIDAALWTVNGGGHIPLFSIEFADMTTDWLLRHSR